jgi:hypothetical protein
MAAIWMLMFPGCRALSAAAILLVALHPARSQADDSIPGKSASTPLSPSGGEVPGTTRPPPPEYDPSKPIPIGYHLEDRGTSALAPLGAVVFTVAYGTASASGFSAFRSSSSSCPADRYLVLPVVGPLAAGAGRDGRVGSACDDPEGFVQAGFIMDGLLQLVGAALFAAGASMSRYALVKDATSSDSNPRGTAWRVVPWNAGRSTAGVDFVSTF